MGNLIDSTAFESHASAWLNHLRSSVVKIKFSVTCLFDLNGQPFNKKLNIFILRLSPTLDKHVADILGLLLWYED